MFLRLVISVTLFEGHTWTVNTDRAESVTCVLWWAHACVVIDSIDARGVVLTVVIFAVVDVDLAGVAFKALWTHTPEMAGTHTDAHTHEQGGTEHTGPHTQHCQQKRLSIKRHTHMHPRAHTHTHTRLVTAVSAPSTYPQKRVIILLTWACLNSVTTTQVYYCTHTHTQRVVYYGSNKEFLCGTHSARLISHYIVDDSSSRWIFRLLLHRRTKRKRAEIEIQTWRRQLKKSSRRDGGRTREETGRETGGAVQEGRTNCLCGRLKSAQSLQTGVGSPPVNSKQPNEEKAILTAGLSS